MKHLCVVLLCCSQVQAQVKDMTVSAPTRLDWQFAAHGFGAAGTKIAADYDSTKQKYQLFIPAGHQAQKPAPLVLFISPGDSPSGLASWQKVCERDGVLFCSPYKAGNNVPAGQRVRVILDALDDVRRKHTVDPEQTYVSGLSGGGRVACTIGFTLPEFFGGVVPVCGTNPFSGPTYLRHRAVDRLSVAFVTGEKDFNRKENEEYMAPYFQELGVRSKLWVAAKVGHQTPGPEVMAEVYSWLKEDLKRRREDARLRPGLAVSAAAAPSSEEQARTFLEAAQAELKQPERIWRGVALLQGTAQRWGKTGPGKEARATLQSIVEDKRLVEAIAQQGADDEQKSVTAQARAFERFGKLDQAIEAWEILAKNYADMAVGANAEKQIIRLRAKRQR